MQKALLIILTFLLIIVVFSVQNVIEVQATFFIWKFNASLPVLLLLSLTIGAYLSFLFSIPGRTGKNKKIESLEKIFPNLQIKFLLRNQKRKNQNNKWLDYGKIEDQNIRKAGVFTT